MRGPALATGGVWRAARRAAEPTDLRPPRVVSAVQAPQPVRHPDPPAAERRGSSHKPRGQTTSSENLTITHISRPNVTLGRTVRIRAVAQSAPFSRDRAPDLLSFSHEYLGDVAQNQLCADSKGRRNPRPGASNYRCGEIASGVMLRWAPLSVREQTKEGRDAGTADKHRRGSACCCGSP